MYLSLRWKAIIEGPNYVQICLISYHYQSESLLVDNIDQWHIRTMDWMITCFAIILLSEASRKNSRMVKALQYSAMSELTLPEGMFAIRLCQILSAQCQACLTRQQYLQECMFHFRKINKITIIIITISNQKITMQEMPLPPRSSFSQHSTAPATMLIHISHTLFQHLMFRHPWKNPRPQELQYKSGHLNSPWQVLPPERSGPSAHSMRSMTLVLKRLTKRILHYDKKNHVEHIVPIVLAIFRPSQSPGSSLVPVLGLRNKPGAF